MSEPVIAQESPYTVPVKAGQDYWWCACGKSATQPFCDGSHKGSDFTPVKFTPEKSGNAYLCGCKQTGKGPFCDGTHNKI